MPQVDFYVLGEPGETALLRVACRVAEKAWEQGLSVYMLTRDEEAAARLDELLWTFRQEGFLPHERWPSTDGTVAPVLVGTAAEPPHVPDLLVNLGAPVPDWYRGCRRVAEVVGGDAELKAAGRGRYRAYRDAGADLRTHEVAP